MTVPDASRLVSAVTPLVDVDLPYRNRQIYMLPIDLDDITCTPDVADYQPILARLCAAAGATHGRAFVTIDEQIVPAGRSQRRPGPHVDGCFAPDVGVWGHPPQPTWLHRCNNIGAATPYQRMAVITAASVPGCRVWRGTFTGTPTASGDLGHIADQLGPGDVLAAHRGYLLSPDAVHESMVFAQATQRTFLRIALPVTFTAEGMA